MLSFIREDSKEYEETERRISNPMRTISKELEIKTISRERKFSPILEIEPAPVIEVPRC